MPRVSIITPTYNHAGYIRECVDGVLAGSFPDWEMLVVDDGSTDDTAAIVASYDDPRIRLFRKPNGGIMRLAEGYNLALAHAQGDLIAILEGDDHWPRDKLALQVPEFDDASVALVYGYAQLVDDDRNDLGRTPPDEIPDDVRTNRPVGTATRGMLTPDQLMFTFPVATMVRKSALEKVGGFRQPPDLPLVDYPTMLAVSLEGEFRFVPKVCGFWRRHVQSTTKSRLPDILEGCYREAMRLAQAERTRLGLTDADLDAIEEKWETFQAFRLTLLGRMLADERRYGDASRAFRMGNRFRRPRTARLVSAFAAGLTRLHLPVESFFRLARRGDWRQQAFFNGDALVQPKDIDRAWPTHRHRDARG